MAKVHIFFNYKGGVAKTSSAISVSFLLRLAGHRVLLMDLDPQGNASESLGADPTAQPKGTPDVFNVLFGVENPQHGELKYVPYEQVLRQSISEYNGAHIDFLPNFRTIRRPDQYWFENNRLNDNDLYIIRDFVQNIIGDLYDDVFIDVNPAACRLNDACLSAANNICIPITADVFSLKGIDYLLREINAIRGTSDDPEYNLGTNPDLVVSGILLTRYKKTLLCQEVENTIREQLPEYYLSTKIHDETMMADAISHNATVYEISKSSNSGYDYMLAAKELGYITLKEFNQLLTMHSQKTTSKKKRGALLTSKSKS